MDVKSLDELKNMSVEELCVYVDTYTKEHESVVSALTKEKEDLLKKIEEDKKATLGTILGLTAKPKNAETEQDTYDISCLL